MIIIAFHKAFWTVMIDAILKVREQRRIARRAKRGMCCNVNCRNRKAKDRRECHTCASRKRNAANPMRTAYNWHKGRAKRRGIEHMITFEEFEKFALETEYLTRTGNQAGSLTIDRIDNTKGYISGNLQPLTRAKNTLKMMQQDEHRYRAGYSWRTRHA